MLANRRGQARLPDHELIPNEVVILAGKAFRARFSGEQYSLEVRKVGLPPLLHMLKPLPSVTLAVTIASVFFNPKDIN